MITGSLTYVELSMLTMKSGGEYAYFIDGLGRLHPFLGPLPAFLYSWIMILLLRPASFAAGCLSIASYIIYLILKVMDIQLEPNMEDLLMKLVAVIFLSKSLLQTLKKKISISFVFIISIDYYTKQLQRQLDRSCG